MITREQCNKLHRAAENPNLLDRTMRAVIAAKAENYEAKRRQDRHTAALMHTEVCKTKAQIYFTRQNLEALGVDLCIQEAVPVARDYLVEWA